MLCANVFTPHASPSPASAPSLGGTKNSLLLPSLGATTLKPILFSGSDTHRQGVRWPFEAGTCHKAHHCCVTIPPITLHRWVLRPKLAKAQTVRSSSP